MASQNDSSLVYSLKDLSLLLASTAPFVPAMLLGSLLESLHDQARTNKSDDCGDKSSLSSCNASLSCSLELMLALMANNEAAEAFLSASLDPADPFWICFIQSQIASPDPMLSRPSAQIMLFTVRSCTLHALQSFGGHTVQIVSKVLADPTVAPADEHHTITLVEIIQAIVESGE